MQQSPEPPASALDAEEDDEFFHQLALGTLWAEFDAGNLMAADQAIFICAARNSAAPEWAVAEIARRAMQAGRAGRHANPATEARDRMNRLHVFAAVEAAKRERSDLKGPKRFAFVGQLLNRFRNSSTTNSEESLKSIYHSVRREENPIENALIALYQRAIHDPDFEVTIPPLLLSSNK